MTWHKVEIGLVTRSHVLSRDKMWDARSWCADELSSDGVLWKQDFEKDWTEFYFAQPQDATLFKLVFG